MKRNTIKWRNLSRAFRKIKLGKQKYELLLCLLILVFLLLLFGLIQGTLGKFSRSFLLMDSAAAAKFDVVITSPKEFWPEQGKSVFEYYFLSATDVQGLAFQVTNNGETDILCKPYINGDITYRIYIAEEVHSEFVVVAKETVTFWLMIAPDGLDESIRNIEFLVDIKQIEGR